MQMMHNKCSCWLTIYAQSLTSTAAAAAVHTAKQTGAGVHAGADNPPLAVQSSCMNNRYCGMLTTQQVSAPGGVAIALPGLGS
jgi:hypothetical protein